MVSSTALLAIGCMLGMRHALNPDHVVAVTAIVTRERSFRRAQWVGALWGIGHSTTVFLVGGAFAAMLVSSTIADPWLAGWYLLLFGIGTIAGMMLLTSAIAMPAVYLAGRFSDARQYLRLASGVASVAFGLLLAHQVGVTEELFGSAVHWVPR